MTVIPFVCLGIGIILGMKYKNPSFLNCTEKISSIALVLLMFVIGFGVGSNNDILKQFPIIGLNCVIIALLVIGCSVLCTYLCEKTILPLEKVHSEMSDNIMQENVNVDCLDEPKQDTKVSNLVWIMPSSIILGVAFGFLFKAILSEESLDKLLTLALIVLYICVGISQGATEGILIYLKKLGLRILVLPLAILVGSLIGGVLATVLLDIPPEASILSAGGMSFYSITGAYMTQSYGISIGTYGFIVNVLRETFTVLLLPILIKISPGSAIAGGAAGNMDTMLAPITKFVGAELGLVTLVTGTILTLVVPFLLPILGNMIG